MKLSKRINKMELSPIRKFNVIAKNRADAGVKIYHLNIGQPDIKTPKCFMESVKNFDNSVVAYTESSGITNLQDAIIAYFKNYNIDFERKNLMMTNGGSEALSMIFTAILNPEDKVMIPEPFYSNYNGFITSADGVIKPITTTPEDGYHYAEKGLLEKSFVKGVKAICCISPGNPTGTVLSLDEMKIICEFAKKHDLWIVADEVYREFVFDGRNVTSFGMLKDYADRIIIVDSVSKRFSACGARVGYIASHNNDLMDSILKIAQGRLCISTLEQIGATALYRMNSKYFDTVRAEYESRRNIAYEELKKIPGLVCQKSGGAFYMTMKLPVKNAEDFLMFLLTEFSDKGETVMFSPAEGFYATSGLGASEIRIAYVLDKEDMGRAVELIRLGLIAYKEKKGD